MKFTTNLSSILLYFAIVHDHMIVYLKRLVAMYKVERSDSAEAFKLLRKMEEQHEHYIGKLKKEHNAEIEKLEQEKASLNDTVCMLLESLSRKEQSLNHALKTLNDSNDGLNSTAVDHDVDDTKQDELEVGSIDDNSAIGAKIVVQLQMQSLKSKIMNKIHNHTHKNELPSQTNDHK